MRNGHYLTHPLALAMLGLWIVNDHVLKAAVHNGVTGKLSDVASLAFFPLLLLAAFEALSPQAASKASTRRWALVAAVTITGAVMIVINTTHFGADAYRVGLAAAQWPLLASAGLARGGALPELHRVALTMDPTDLWTLPALLVPLWIAGRSSSG